ncbi:MAG TPA: NRDE family protein [Pseudomonadales bacterium]|nr:NRDE family protein [Pseudomonadales bacterium]
MCLILLAVRPDAAHQLVVAANRDEQYARPTARAGWWQDHSHILAGRDLEAGGTWLGVTDKGRFAAVTNFREDPPEPLPPRSRGELTLGFLAGTRAPGEYLENVHADADEYRGFNLIVSDGQRCCYYSNREGRIRELTPGFYGLSNQLLDCDWPKVIRGRKQLARLEDSGFDTDSLFELLFCKGDGEPYSQSFIATERYGTSASTVVKIGAAGNVCFEERNFRPMGEPDSVQSYEFEIQG